MSKNKKIFAAFLALIIAAITVFSAPIFAMSYPDVFEAPNYTDNQELKTRMETIVEAFPSSFTDEKGEGIVFGGAEECLSYARYVYYHLFDRMDYIGANLRGGNRHYTFEDGSVGITQTPEQLKSEFKSLNIKFGTMIYYGPAADSASEHAMIVLDYDDYGVTVLHGSWGGKYCVRMTVFSWQEMIDSFGQLCWVRAPWDYPDIETVQTESLSIEGKDGAFTNSRVEYKAVFMPENATLQSVVWSVENISGEATIDNNGILHATKAGIVQITAKTRDNSGVFATKNVRINNPSDVINIKAQTQGLNKVILSWDKCRGVDGYMVYRSTSLTNTYTPIATINSGSQCTFEDTVNFGQEYYYKICSYKVKHGIIIIGEKSSFVGARIALESQTTARSLSNGKNGNF